MNIKLILFSYKFILVINLYSLRNWSGNVLYISVSKNFYIKFFCHWYLIPYSVAWFRFLIRDSIVLRLTSSPLKCALVYRKKSFSVKQQLCLYCKRNQTNTCFTGICYQRNHRQHTNEIREARWYVVAVGGNLLEIQVNSVSYTPQCNEITCARQKINMSDMF